MAEVTTDEFYGILSRHKLGRDLKELLPKEYPEIEITVLMGTTLPSRQHFVHGAYFFQDTMEMALEDLEKDESFVAKPYFLSKGTINEIESGNLTMLNNFNTRLRISQADQLNIYEQLDRSLYERGRMVERDLSS